MDFGKRSGGDSRVTRPAETGSGKKGEEITRSRFTFFQYPIAKAAQYGDDSGICLYPVFFPVHCTALMRST